MLFETEPDYYQAIADELFSIYKKPWREVRVDVERSSSSMTLQVVYYDGVGGEDSKIRIQRLDDYFYEIAYVMSTEELGFYKKGVFIMNREGKYSANFEY